MFVNVCPGASTQYSYFSLRLPPVAAAVVNQALGREGQDEEMYFAVIVQHQFSNVKLLIIEQ